MGEEKQGSGAALPQGVGQGVLPKEHWGGQEGGQEEGVAHDYSTGNGEGDCVAVLPYPSYVLPAGR